MLRWPGRSQLMTRGCSILGRPALTLSGRATGLLLALVGTLIDSCEALVVRRMGLYLDDWQQRGQWDGDRAIAGRIVIFHKYLFTMLFALISLVATTSGGVGELLNGIRAGPKHIFVAALSQALISTLVTLALLETETATVYLLFLLGPLWAAIFGRFFLLEPIRRCTALALLLSLGAISVMKFPAIINNGDGDERGALNLGDLYAVAAGGSLGVLLTISRSAALHAPKARMVCAPILGSLACVIIASIMLSTSGHTPLPRCGDGMDAFAFVGLAAATGFGTATFYVCTLLAAKYVTGAEVGLVKMLETVLGPFWVFVGLGEVPTSWTFIGGSLLLLTLFSHALFTSNALPLECLRSQQFQSGTLELRRVNPSPGNSNPPSKSDSRLASREPSRQQSAAASPALGVHARGVVGGEH